MSEAALTRIAHILKVEDDLSKVPELQQQFIKEKSSVDMRLNSTVQVQIESIMSNLTNLNESATKLNSIKGSLSKVNEVYAESITNISQYDMVRQMTSVNQFLTQVKNLYTDISNFKSFLEHIDKLIEDELHYISEDILYTLPNLFHIHYNLSQARNFLDYLEEYSKPLSHDFQTIIFKIISPIKKSIKKFDELLKEIIISITEALKDGNNELVLKLIKIIDFETIEDTKFSLFNSLNVKGSCDFKSINYANFRGSKRNYRKFFYDKLEDSLDETFEKCVEHFANDKMLVYDNLNWLEDELLFVSESLDPLFPTNWEISGFIQNAYYNKLHKFTMEIINQDPPAEDLMKILAYDNHYSKFINELKTPLSNTASDNKVSVKKEQKSILGDDLKNIVLEDYLKVIVSKMEEWNNNLIDLESKTFVEREAPPDIYTYHQVIEDEDVHDQLIMLDVDMDVYVLPDFKTQLSMLKEQADVASDSGYSKILVGVIENWSICYIRRALNYQRLIEQEFERYMSIYNNEKFLVRESRTRRLFKRSVSEPEIDLENMTPEEISKISKPGLIEYLTALGNTYEINTDRLQDKFLPNYLGKVHSTYQKTIEQAFRDTLTPSTELNAQVIRTIVDIIVNDLYPSLSTVFTKSWYDDSKSHQDEPILAQLVTETIVEYMEELRSHASYDIYLVSFNILLDTFISSYIKIGFENILLGSGKKIDPKAVKKFKSFSEAIGRDVTLFYGGLEPLFTRKDSAYLLNSLKAIEFLGDLATCEDPMNFIPAMWENEILTTFYYCSVEYVRGICMCRKDMEKAQINQLIDQLIGLQKNYHDAVDPPSLPTGTLNDFTFNHS